MVAIFYYFYFTLLVIQPNYSNTHEHVTAFPELSDSFFGIAGITLTAHYIHRVAEGWSERRCNP